jgi:hypothetical protein
MEGGFGWRNNGGIFFCLAGRPTSRSTAADLGWVSYPALLSPSFSYIIFLQNSHPPMLSFASVLCCTATRINRPGGHGKIFGVHCDEGGVVESLDVKYTITGGFDRQIDPDLVKPHQELERAGRQRRTREVFTVPVDDKENEAKTTKKNIATQKSKVAKKSKPVKTSEKAEKEKPKTATVKSKKRKKTVTNDTSEVQSVQEPENSIPKFIYCSMLSPGRAALSPHFTSPLTAECGVEAQPRRQYMLSSDDAKVEPEGPSSFSTCSPASDARSCVKKSKAADSPISRVKSLGRGDYVEIPETKKTLKAKGSRPKAAHGPRVKVTLREVYDDQWQKANDFVKDVVTDGGKTKEKEEASKEPELPEVDERQSSFLAVFNDLLQNNDGTIEEEGLLAKVNQLSAQRFKDGMIFAEADVDQILLHLCEENKIMRCDGQVYSI